MPSYMVRDFLLAKKVNENVAPEILNKPMLGSIQLTNLGNATDINDHSQRGIRPCIVWNNYEAIPEILTSIVIPLTGTIKALHIPVHVVIKANKTNGLTKDSMTLVEQLTTVNNYQFVKSLGMIDYEDYKRIEKAFEIQFPLLQLIDEETKQEVNKIWENYLRSAHNIMVE